MTELFAPALFERLRTLARPFVWGRKALHVVLTEELRAAGVTHTALLDEQRQTADRLHALMQEHARLNERYGATGADLTRLRESHARLEQTLNVTRTEHWSAQEEWENERQTLEATAAHLQAGLSEKAQAVGALQQILDQQRAEHEELSRRHANLQEASAQARTRHQSSRATWERDRQTLEETATHLQTGLVQQLQATATLQQKLARQCAEHDELGRRHAHLEQALDEARIQHQDARKTWEQDRRILEATIARLQTELSEKGEAIYDLQEIVAQRATEYEELGRRHARLEQAFDEARTEHRTACEGWERDRQTLDEHAECLLARLSEKTATVNTLQQTIDQQHLDYAGLRQQFTSLEERHGDTWIRFQLVSRLLAAQPLKNAGRARFGQLVAQYRAHVTQSALRSVAEARVLAGIELIDRELDFLLEFPELSTRTVASVVGGFNSGKSEFINSFILDHGIRLAIGVRPVTAIPSYVTYSDTSVIRGFTVAGAQVRLDVHEFGRMSHAFLKSFEFDLKRLMPFMCLGTRMNPAYFSQLCLLDTPGYNPPATASAYSQHDRSTALQAARQSNALLWLIGVDANGTVPDSDLGFIRDIGIEQRPVYVVLNKADLKSETELRDIIEDVRAVLGQEDISVAGISAYSSTRREVVLSDGPSLFDFLVHYNEAGRAREPVVQRLQAIFTNYEKTLQADIDTIRSQRRCVNDLQLDALQFGGEEACHHITQRLEQLDVTLASMPLEQAVEDARALWVTLRDALREALPETGLYGSR